MRTSLDLDLPASAWPADSFHAFLSAARLPFYARSRHGQIHAPPPGVLADEADALRGIDHRRVTGVVVSGPAGAGKTRLTREIARAAGSAGWLVGHAATAFDPARLDAWLATAAARHPVLLVADDAEAHPDLERLVDWVNARSDAQGRRVAYVANCRTAYHPRMPAPMRHHRIDLAPGDDAAAAWERGYRAAVVAHILAHASLDGDARARRLGDDSPVVAAILAWLAARGRRAELAAMLEDGDGWRWLARRALALPGARDIDVAGVGASPAWADDRAPTGAAADAGVVAAAAALLPLPIGPAGAIDPAVREALDRLAADGWVERARPATPLAGRPAPTESPHETRHAGANTPPAFRAAHDVWADEVMLSGLAAGGSAEPFVASLLSTAAACGALHAALVALQRVHDRPALVGVDWAAVLLDAADRAPEAWRAVRALLLTTPLLTTRARLSTLVDRADLWRSAERDAAVQRALAWHARDVSRIGWSGTGEAARVAFLDAVSRALAEPRADDVLVAWALRFAPGRFRDAALARIHEAPARFECHGPLVAWLEAVRATDDVGGAMADWLRAHGRRFHASHVCTAWLRAGGDPAAVRPALVEWFGEHGAETDASHVYAAWLDAGGDRGLVEPHLPAWIERHGSEAPAEYVYRAWLAAGGERSLITARVTAWLGATPPETQSDHLLLAWLRSGGPWDAVREAALAWLQAHADEADATYVLRYVVTKTDLPARSVEAALAWCERFADHVDALNRLAHLARGGVPDTLADRLVDAAASVLANRLARTDLEASEREQIATVLSTLAVVGVGGPRQFGRVNRFLVEWLRHPQSYDAGVTPDASDQAPEVVARVVALLRAGKLDPRADATALARFATWLARWESPTREKALARLAGSLRADGPRADAPRGAPPTGGAPRGGPP